MMLLRATRCVPLLLSSAKTHCCPCVDTAQEQWHTLQINSDESLVIAGFRPLFAHLDTLHGLSQTFLKLVVVQPLDMTIPK